MSSKTRARRLALLLLAAATPALAQDYPPASDSAGLISWLGASTNIEPDTVVSVTPELVVAIVGKTPTSGGPVRVTLREEVIAPAYVQSVGGRSSLMSMEIHCEERRVRMDERRLYSGLNLTGDVATSQPSADWVRIPEGSIMDEVARAACEPAFAWPLQTSKVNPAIPVVAPARSEPAELKIAAAEPPAPPETASLPAPPANEEPKLAKAAPPLPAAPPAELSAPASPRPDNEPAVPDAVAVDVAVAEPAPAARAEPSPVDVSVAVQIGAYETRDAAEAAWAALSTHRPVVVEGLRFKVRPARVKGRDWLRGLVVGFSNRRDALAFCTAIAGGEHGCIQRTLRD